MNWVFKVEPAKGFEPPTYCLQNSCSTTELSWQSPAGQDNILCATFFLAPFFLYYVINDQS